MNLRQLEIFRAIMRGGSVTEAARLLGVSQPAVSKLLRHTEDQLGIRLFERRHGRLFPTAEAEALYPPVDSIFGNIDTVQKIAQDLRDLRTGVVRVATIPTLGISLLPSAIARFVSAHRDVRVGIKVVNAEQVVERVIQQQVDLGIVYALAQQHDALIVKELSRAEVVCVAPEGHPLAAHREVCPPDIAPFPLISVNRMTPVGLFIDEAFREHNVTRMPLVEVSHSAIAYELVDVGVGVAVVDPFGGAETKYPRLVNIPFRPQIRINPRVIYSATRPLSRINRAFLSALVASSKDRGATDASSVPSASVLGRRLSAARA